MIDIDFYMKVFELKKRLLNGEIMERSVVIDAIEEYRSKKPVVYNIETDNTCNMRCEMCPRTTLMTRPLENLELDVFKKIVDELEPFPAGKWGEWENFVSNNYGISKTDMSENHFFLYIIPKVIVLHGYGDPLLDPHMPERVKLMNERRIPSYFSCNPANIDLERTERMFDSGLGYIKYSVESTDDERHKEIRGKASSFTKSYEKIMKVLELKDKHDYQTTIVITMLNLNKPWQDEDFENLKAKFRGMDVYVYLKSQDTRWYSNNQEATRSIHWLEFCQFPWSSMTIKSNGEAAMCVEDFDNEIILGDAASVSLYDIWNGEKYRRLREDHFNVTPGIRCSERCDMRLIGSLLGQ